MPFNDRSLARSLHVGGDFPESRIKPRSAYIHARTVCDKLANVRVRSTCVAFIYPERLGANVPYAYVLYVILLSVEYGRSLAGGDA